MAEEEKVKVKAPHAIRDEDTPEGKMELQFRVLGNEMIGIKMIVDDMKMKWVAIGLVGILVMTWAAAEFSSVITQSGTDTTYVIEE
jgi:hypothetical protein